MLWGTLARYALTSKSTPQAWSGRKPKVKESSWEWRAQVGRAKVPCQNRWALAGGRRSRADLWASKINQAKKVKLGSKRPTFKLKTNVKPQMCDAFGPGRKTDIPALRSSSGGIPASACWPWCPPWVGTPGCAWSRCPSWRTAPSRPGRRFRSGRRRPGRRRLQRRRHPWGFLGVTGRQQVWDSGTFPAVEAGRVHFDGAICAGGKKNSRISFYTADVFEGVDAAGHTDDFHWVHIVHKVPLP